jgi:hypothetical protein
MNPVKDMAAAPGGLVSSSTAWVTAIGVIGGATISGIVAVFLAFIQRKSLNDQADRQLRSQQDQLRAQAAADYRKWLLEQQRSAYFEFLVSVEGLRELLIQLSEHFRGNWPRRDGVSAAEIAQIDSLAARLRERQEETRRSGQLVRLAGPSRMSDAAQRTVGAATCVAGVVDEHVRSARSNARPSSGKSLSEAGQDLTMATDAFIKQASVVLAEE